MPPQSPGASHFLLEKPFETLQSPVAFKGNLKFRDIEVCCVVQSLEERLVEYFREAFRPGTARIHGNVEYDRFEGYAPVDGVEQVAYSRVVGRFLEKVGRARGADCSVRDGVPKHFRKGGFSRTEEARYPDSDSFPRCGRAFSNFLEDLDIALSNGVGGHIFVHFDGESFFIILVDLDDLFDMPFDRFCEQASHPLHLCPTSVYFHPVAVRSQTSLGRKVVEAEVRSVFEMSRVEEHYRDAGPVFKRSEER